MDEVKELIDQLSKHNIKVVDFDEDEESTKNRLARLLRGRKLRGHIAPSSWRDPSGELTIYVPKHYKRTPEAYKRFLIEEVKHVDQLRESPFSTAAGLGLGILKERFSYLPSWLLQQLPEFYTVEDQYEYMDKIEEVLERGGDLDEVESFSWKDRSGIGQLFRDLHYDPYADLESVEGIHRNEERYAPVLKKYGVYDEGDEMGRSGVDEEIEIEGKQAGGYVMNYADYGRSYK